MLTTSFCILCDVMKLIWLFVTFLALSASLFSQAATQNDEDFQSWNDIQVNMSLSKKLDYFNKVTMRIGNDISTLRDGRFSVGFVWKPGKSLSISPFFWYIKARNTSGQFRIENRLNLSATYRFPINGFGLSHRSTYEKRLRRPVNTWRYRGQITIEKDIPKSLIEGAKLFISNELFYDSGVGKFTRNRFSVGVSKAISKKVGVDLYYTRQNDGYTRPGDLNIIWSAWKIRL